MKIRTFCLLACLMVCMGVFAQPYSWQTRGVGGGGALFFSTINPGNDNEFYVACDMSALFHTTDFGLSYDQVHFSRLPVFNNSTYEFTIDGNIAYCRFNDGNTGYPVRTTDGGVTWQPLPGNPDPWEEVYTLKADYYHPARIILGYYGMIYFSADQGSTFSLVKTASNMGAGLRIAGVFFEGDNIYIGTNEGVVYSINGGSSFSSLATTGMEANEVVLAFAGAKQGIVTRFFCISAYNSDVYNGLYPWDYWNLLKHVYSLDLGTDQWIQKMNGIDPATDFCMYIGMAWNDINTVYLGGSNSANNSPNVIKTTDTGATWTKVFLADNNLNIVTGWSGYQGDRTWGYGETCFGISVAPLNANKVVFGDFGFVHLTNDGGATWWQAYLAAADQHPAGNPTPKYQSYHSIGLENTSCWQVHWSDAVTLIAGTSNIHDLYQSTRLTDAILDGNDPNGKLISSTDKGHTWQNLKVFNHPVFWVAVDPTNPDIGYASVVHYGGGTGEGGIWKTADLTNLGSSAWTKLTDSQFDRVTSIMFNPQQNNQAFLTTETQGLWVSNNMNDATPSWNLVASYPFRQPERVFFNPYDPDKVWVTSFGNGVRVGSMSASGVDFPASRTSGFRFFPNPAKDILTVTLLSPEAQSSEFPLLIRDLTGRILHSQTASAPSVSVSVTGLPTGVYLLQVGDGVQKWVKE